MRSIQVQFASGREVLNNYWGFLRNGGLVLVDPHDLTEGDSVVLDVKIKSLKRTYKLAAHVVKRAPDGARAFVAFDEGQEQDLMLNAAWADSHEVPQRKHRRYPTGTQVLYAGGNEAPTHAGQILDVSPGGCRLRGPHILSVGARIRVLAVGIELDGQVRWSAGGREMGVEFQKPALVVQALLDEAH
jgi:PilZ domain-containing protein